MNAYRENLYLHIERRREMKLRAQRICILLALASILLFMFTACTVARGNANGYTLASLGGDLEDVEITQNQFKARKVNNSTAFVAVLKQVRAMWQSYLALQGLEFLGDKYFDQQGQEIASSQTVKLEELRNAKDIELANLELEELKLLEAAPAP